MTLEEFSTNVWPFYLTLERDFINTLNYVTFSTDNFATFSVEFERQILSIGSEIDIVCKLLCRELQPDVRPNNIRDYFTILSALDGFMSTQVSYGIQNYMISPFENWTHETSPSWWTSYNKLKHDRITDCNFKLGNLGNTFRALAGLYAANRFLFKQLSINHPHKDPNPASKIFSMVGWSVYIPIGNGFYNVLDANGQMGIIHE